jgi:hypothetical protein
VSRKIPLVCEICDAMWFVGRYGEQALCPKCGFPNEVDLDGYDDRRREDDCQ